MRCVTQFSKVQRDTNPSLIPLISSYVSEVSGAYRESHVPKEACQDSDEQYDGLPCGPVIDLFSS
jgi:hypothetical protein